MAGMILVAGESLVDLIPLGGTSYDAVLGGSPYNTAIGLGRLGPPTGYAWRVSTDSMGEAMMERLAASGVDLSLVSRAAAPSPLAFVTRGTQATGARYAFYLGSTAYDGPAALAVDWPDHVGHLHVGSFSATDGAHGARALEAMRAAPAGATTSYDPNIRPMVIGPPAETVPLVEARVRAATVVKVSDEDLAWLYPGRDPGQAAAAWAGLGPRLVVLTRGGEGATAYFGEGKAEATAPAITVVDTVGAGDSFMAALLAIMHGQGALGRGSAAMPWSERDVASWIGFAVTAAAITCTRKGANPPTRDEVQRAGPGSAPS